MEGLGVGLEGEFGFPVVTAFVVCEGWRLRIELEVEIGCSAVGVRVEFRVCGEVGVRVCCEVCVLRGALFNVGVEVCEEVVEEVVEYAMGR